ncbi:MAG: DUF4338 domain-containing protein [Planctomycetes bacterium]|nr:DUF4338 domain-containing protein [Planctomycetota bacterium]
MDTVITYRGREIGPEEISFILKITKEYWGRGRTAISRELCRHWDWRQPNGHLKDMVCRGLLLKLERAGHIRLPPRSPNWVYRVRKPRIQPLKVDTTPIEQPLKELVPIQWLQVRRTGAQEALFNHLIATYHYLGYCQTVGEHLKYLAFSHGRPIACLSWGSAAWKVDCRDQHIGWSAAVRKQNLYRIINNTRFLVLPFVHVSNLASHLLSQNLRLLLGDWQRIYAHRPVLAETFVQEPYAGTCYRAANWIRLGTTKGRGRYDIKNRCAQPVKAVFVYPIHKQFRRILCNG